MKKKIQQLIVQNKTEEAIEQLLSVVDELLKNDLLLLQARYKKMVREDRLYLTSRENLSVEYNQLNHSLLEMLDEIYSEPLNSVNTNEKSDDSDKWQKGKWWKRWVVVAGILGAVASLAQISGIDLLWFLNSKNTSEKVNLTVYVHGPKGQRDVVLDNEGLLSIGVGNRMVERKIGTKGHTYFGVEASKLFGQEIIVFLEADHYELAKGNDKFEFDDSTVYLKVVPKLVEKLESTLIETSPTDLEDTEVGKQKKQKENTPSHVTEKAILSIKPPSLDLPPLKVGTVGKFKFEITNNSLIKANNVRVIISNSAIQLQSNYLFDLNPGATEILSFNLQSSGLNRGTFKEVIIIKGDNISDSQLFRLSADIIAQKKENKTTLVNCPIDKINCKISFYDRFQKKNIKFKTDSLGFGQFKISDNLKGDKVEVIYTCKGDVSNTQTVRVHADSGCFALPNY